MLDIDDDEAYGMAFSKKIKSEDRFKKFILNM